MPGLETILGSIEKDGRSQADSIISSAEKKAEKIRSEGEAAAKAAHDEYIENCKAQCEREYKSACSAAEADMKRKLLACRMDCIDGVIEGAISKINADRGAEYFAALLAMAEKRLKKGNGVMYFGADDLRSLPADFEKKLGSLAERKGSSVVISDKPADIENGFILSYGNISENCCLSEIAESEKEALRDKIAEVLFTQR